MLVLGTLVLSRSGYGVMYLDQAQAFLTFYAGVFSLVALSITVMLGLLATERIVLGIRQRVYAQLVHRAFALVGVGFLIVHIAMKIAAGLVPSYGSVVPSTNLYVGMGAVASDLFIMVIATGVMRGRFAQAERPWLWRGIHDMAYAAWPLSILHGLAAGRTPAAWVSWSYVLCLLAVGAALMLRVVVSARPVRVSQPAAKPTGKAAPLDADNWLKDIKRGLNTVKPRSADMDTEPVPEVPSQTERPKLRRVV
ncbi:hypothetical protein J5X84_03030 [Streptosporangiaceae bacterium NEAU-GS5]|nr:hypothetical protein [Streptosporangiaceae bacterium NEAU-GS5]